MCYLWYIGYFEVMQLKISRLEKKIIIIIIIPLLLMLLLSLLLPLPLLQSKRGNFHVKYSSLDQKKGAILIIKDRKL